MKTMRWFCLVLAAAILWGGSAWADGACVQTASANRSSGSVVITFVCTGDVANGSIPATAFSTANMALIKGTHFLYSVIAYPTSGGTAPDAADVTVSMKGLDLLGGKGANLIHATNPQEVTPYSLFTTMYKFFRIYDTLTLGVANQATASAEYTIDFVFER